MKNSAPEEPGVKEMPRFKAVGLRSDPSRPFAWYVIDRAVPGEPMGVGIAQAEGREEVAKANAERIALALNTVGRLLVDDPDPYMVADVERIRTNLARLSIETSRQAFTAFQSNDRESGQLLDAEAQFLGLAADMFRRLMSELLKFRMIEDRVPVMVDALRHSALTFRVNESTTREQARTVDGVSEDPSRAAGIERAAEAWAQAAELCERALAIQGGSLVGVTAGGDPPTPPQRHEAANRDRVRAHDGRDAVLQRPDVGEAIAYSIATRRGADWAKATEEGRNAFREEARDLLCIAARAPRG